MADEPLSSRLRKRQRVTAGTAERMDQLLELMEKCHKVVVFTGSGLSATSGMSMFSTKNGLYERARRKFKIQDGIRLFSYPFYKQRRADVQAFFAQIYSEAQASQAARGHHALAQLHQLGRLQRHYTLNIDGLAEVVGMDSWHHEFNPAGITVEMHGNIRDVVCPSCHAVEQLNRSIINTMKQKQPVNCSNCSEGEVRFKVMLYDDEEGDCITPEDVWEVLEQDLASADAVVWLGISFEQSASTEYFRKVRYMLQCSGRLAEVPQVVINPSEDALFNLMSSCAKKEDIEVLEILESSDDVLPKLADHLQSLHLGGGSKQRTSGSPPKQEQQQQQQRPRPWRKQYSEEYEAGHQVGDEEEPAQQEDTDSEEEELHRWWKKQNAQQSKDPSRPQQQQQQRRRTPSVKQEQQSVQPGRQRQPQIGAGAGVAPRAAPTGLAPAPAGCQQPLLQQLLMMPQGQQLLQHLAAQQQAAAAIGSAQLSGLPQPVAAMQSVQLAAAAALQAMQQQQQQQHHHQHRPEQVPVGLSAVLTSSQQQQQQQQQQQRQQQQRHHPAGVGQQPVAVAPVSTLHKQVVQAPAEGGAADAAHLHAAAAAAGAATAAVPGGLLHIQQQPHEEGRMQDHPPELVSSHVPAPVSPTHATQDVQACASAAATTAVQQSAVAGQVQQAAQKPEQLQGLGALQQVEATHGEEQESGVDQQH